MKILHIIQKSQNRGAEIFTCQLSNHLLELGHSVKIVSLFKGEAILPFDGQIQSLNASPKSRFFDFSTWRKLAKIIKDFNPDLVQVNAGDTLKYSVFSKFFFDWKAPIISRNASEIGSYIKSLPQKLLNSYFYKKVDYTISVSKASEKDLLIQFPFLFGRTEVIPVGLEIIEKIEPIKWKHSNLNNIVHVGGFTFEKNHKGLLRIFSLVMESNKRVHLHLVGDGPLRKEIEEKVLELNLERFVSFHGFVTNPLSYISAADILVLPSIIEGLPGVLLEAMYVMTPVIAYDVGGISEIIKQDTGVIIKKNYEKEFAQSIVKNLKEKDLETLNNAFIQVTTNYLNFQLALRFVKAYQKSIKSST